MRSSGDANPNLISQGDAQLGALMALKRQLSQASPASLAMVRAEIASCIANASSVARQAEVAVASSAGMSASLASASQAAHDAVAGFEDAYFKQRKFDPYLHFASEEDEREFRRREAERQQQIKEASALGTPEGNKKAIDLSIDQMHDAGAHGADKSPDYAPMLGNLAQRKAALDAQIEDSKPKAAPTVASNVDPLDAPSTTASVPADLLAKFKAAGVIVADQNGTGHGVSDNAQQERDGHVPS